MSTSFRLTGKDIVFSGVLVLSLGSLLFSLEPLLTNPDTENAGYRMAILLTAIALLGIIPFARKLRDDSRQARVTYALLAGLLVACWAVVWVILSAPFDLRIFLLLIGAHSVLWSLWQLKLAVQIRIVRVKAAILTVLAAWTSIVGIAISVQGGLSRITALAVGASYLVGVGIDLILLRLYLYSDLIAPYPTDIAIATREEKDSMFHVTTT